MNLSEPYQRGIRLAIAVLLACLIGYGLILPSHGIHVAHKKEFSNGLKWSAITCIVVSAPVIGRAAQTGAERILGTVTGGFLGFGIFRIGSDYWNQFSDGVVLSIAAAIVAFTSITIGAAYGLENSTKLYALTFMLVSFGSENLATNKGALALTLTRISGICFGVFLSEVTSVLIFPKSATQEAIVLLLKSLDNLTELNAIAWQHGPLFRPDWRSALPGEGKNPLASWWRSKGKVLKTSQWEGDPCKREADFEEECEKVFMQTYSFLNKVQDQLTPARSEIYIGHFRKRMYFLPGIPWLQIGQRVLPEAEIQMLATCIRRVARLLWSVHLSFQEGFDKNMLAMLQQQYPQGLMPELAQHTQGCLQDMLDAFPNAENVSSSHLVSLVSGVESLLRISDYQRRRVLHHMKRSQSEAESSSRPSKSQKIPQVPSERENGRPRTLPRDYTFGRSKSKRLENPRAFRSGNNPPRNPGSSYRVRDRSSLDGADDADLETPLLPGSPSSPRNAENDRDHQSSRAEMNTKASAFASLASTAYCGSPSEVFQNLPSGLEIIVDPASPPGGAHVDAADADEEEDSGQVQIHLRKVPSGDLIVFPETAEGFVDKVRWYSFQFLMEELTEELEEMHAVINKLLQKLPRPCYP